MLYLRGAGSVIFTFEGRRVAPPAAKRGPLRVAPALSSLLEGPFTTVLGDVHQSQAALQRDIAQFMRENGDTAVEGQSLSRLTQRCVLQFGQDVLLTLFQAALTATVGAPVRARGASRGRGVPPGVHFTLLWHPHLERAGIAEQQKDRTVYAIQQSLGQAGGKPRFVKRAAGAPTWKMEPSPPKRFDLDREIVVIRVYGGYSPEARPIFSAPLVTEDDHIRGMFGVEAARPPMWMEDLLARPRIHPGLFVGLSVLDWRHRMLLNWLYDRHPSPEGSLAILTPQTDAREEAIWDGGGGLPGTARIAAITEDPELLAPLLDEIERPGAA